MGSVAAQKNEELAAAFHAQLPAFVDEREIKSGVWAPSPGAVTLRDYFAAHALSGLLARYSTPPQGVTDDVARTAYALADAMVATRGTCPYGWMREEGR